MTPIQLDRFKTQLTEFYKLTKKLIEDNNWKAPEYICANVLLQNMAFKSVDCKGYDHDEEVSRVNKKISSLNALSNYYKQHWFIELIKQEVDMIYIGVTYE